jgi:putative transcriptional regulator
MESMIQNICILLKKANFETFVLDQFSSKKNKFCFDLLAKKNNTIFSVKVFPNIDNLNPDLVNDIKSLSILLKSRPLLIGIKNRYQKLEDNAIYIREDLPFISIKTLEKMILKNEYPYVLARRGGGIIFLDGDLMKSIREENQISRKELSEKLGVTKRTVSAYENDTMRPSENVAEKILEILKNSNIFRKMNPFDWGIKFSEEPSYSFEDLDLSSFESHIYEVIEDIGISSYWYKKGPIPFKLSIYSQSKKKANFYPIFSGISEEQGKMPAKNLKCLKSFTRLFDKKALFIVGNNIKISESIKKNIVPIVKIKDLERLDDEEEFIDLISSNKKKE